MRAVTKLGVTFGVLTVFLIIGTQTGQRETPAPTAPQGNEAGEVPTLPATHAEPNGEGAFKPTNEGAGPSMDRDSQTEPEPEPKAPANTGAGGKVQ